MRRLTVRRGATARDSCMQSGSGSQEGAPVTNEYEPLRLGRFTRENWIEI